jgi:hypothetical protein
MACLFSRTLSRPYFLTVCREDRLLEGLFSLFPCHLCKESSLHESYAMPFYLYLTSPYPYTLAVLSVSSMYV